MKKAENPGKHIRLIDDPSKFLEMFNIPEHLGVRFKELHNRALDKGDDCIGDLLDLVLKYPEVPQLKDMLALSYLVAGNANKHEEVSQWILKEHPDYLFGRLSIAMACIEDADYEGVTEVLGGDLELQSLYPDRKEFMVEEFTAYELCVIEYLCDIGDFERAKARHKRMKEIVPGHRDTKQARDIIESKEEFYSELELYGEEGSIRLPDLTHEEVGYLYTEDLTIPPNMLNGILKLPRESLIRDLELTIRHAIDHYEHYAEFESEDYLNENETSFPMHAIFLLGELRAEESLPVVLDFLRGDDAFLWFWLGDILTEGIWNPLYFLGNRQLGMLGDFIREPEGYTYSVANASVVVFLVVINQPDRREEAVDWYRHLLGEFTEKAKKNTLKDKGLVELVTGDVIECRLSELLPEVTELFDLGCVDMREYPSQAQIAAEIREPVYDYLDRPLDGIHGIYERMRENFGTTDEDLW